MRSSADIAVERTTIVTSAPSLRKMFAISIAMIPDPATTTDFGAYNDQQWSRTLSDAIQKVLELFRH